MTIDRSTLVEAVRVCACFNLRRASRTVTRFYDEVLEPGGLRSTGFAALLAIQIEGVPTLPKLSRALGVDRSTLTRNLQPLVRQGLVKIGASAGARTATARLTPKGEKTLAACVPLWRTAQGRFEGQVGSKEWQAVLAALAQVDAIAG